MPKSTLAELDSSLYPQVWEQQNFNDAQALLMAILSGSITPDPYAFTKHLQANEAYQEWINGSVFGRYIQCNFSAFSRQTEDSFNMDIPVLFRNELMRHTQYLPLEQILFVAGNIPTSVRRAKLFTSTLNPATVVIEAQKLKQEAAKLTVANNQALIINQIKVKGKQVAGFPTRHNKRTSERIRNEVLILDFSDLRLVEEQDIERSPINQSIVLRCYELR